MIIGVPKEIKNNENRVGMTPSGVVTADGTVATRFPRINEYAGTGPTEEQYKRVTIPLIRGGASKINAGALPFQLETSNYGTISATLGENSLVAMAYAGVIAFIIIAIIMILFYRLPGFVAVISLLGQMGLAIAAVSGYFPVFSSFTMTLPGIAGLILSIGMGVDCNVITAERIKEELKAGRTLDGALERGTKNSLSAIVDGNMTVIIVSIILMLVFGPANILSIIFGESTTGTIYSFGYTLLVGVIANFIMGVFCTRIMLRSVAGFKFLRKKWLFGGAKND